MKKIKKLIIGFVVGMIIGMWFGINIGRDRPLLSNPFTQSTVQKKLRETGGVVLEKSGKALEKSGKALRDNIMDR